MRKTFILLLMTTLVTTISAQTDLRTASAGDGKAFRYFSEQFADARILRYQVPGFDSLPLDQKLLVYYLSQAALCGRDITWDQNCRWNLIVRSTLEAILNNYTGNRSVAEFMAFTDYTKQVWFCNGIHHHYSTDKLTPGFSPEYFTLLLRNLKPFNLPLAKGQKMDDFIEEILPVIFDPEVVAKRVSLDKEGDLVRNSACNYYEGVTQQEAEEFYRQMKSDVSRAKGDTMVSFGLNSRLVKQKGKVVEQVYRSGGHYGKAIDQILFWLEKALPLAENDKQAESIRLLIKYYKTGDLSVWDQYNIAWVKDVDARVDFVNGFIEVYGDPLAMKGAWESVVNFKDIEATRRTEVLSRNAQYFEDNSPVDGKFKKKSVKGVTAKVITVAQLGGDCHPTTPIGINLPNANWIRKDFGSKSVTMDNITYAYDQAAKGNGFLEEFASSDEEIRRAQTYGYLAGCLHTDLHECLGHGSGQLLPGVTGDALRNYHSAIEETRADLFALYYLLDPKMIELGLVPNEEVGKAAYDKFIMNGLMTQLVRIQPGKKIEQAHMRNRSLIAHWVYEHGKEKNVVERLDLKGKTFFRINDYRGVRELFSQLLQIVQRITSEGDYAAAGKLVEMYGVEVDQELHAQVLDRYRKLNIAPYAGFINPEYRLVEEDGKIRDVTISYPDNFSRQMMGYSKKYSFVPVR